MGNSLSRVFNYFLSIELLSLSCNDDIEEHNLPKRDENSDKTKKSSDTYNELETDESSPILHKRKPEMFQNFKTNQIKYTTKVNFSENRTPDLKDFNILKMIGKGAFGHVYLIQHKYTENYFAMKILDKKKVREMNQINCTKLEKSIMERLCHPFIVTLYLSFQSSKKLYLVTEFLPGGELFYHLRREIRFTEERVKYYAAEIILALEYLHKLNIIYRDLKPENILLARDGHLKLTDFGLSRFVKEGFSRLNNSFSVIEGLSKDVIEEERAYTICGTPEYIAPEILTGTGYDKSVDWWSLGVLIYEMLCGYSPFKKLRDLKLDINQYFKPIDLSNKSFSSEVKELLEGLLKINPKERLGYSSLDADQIKQHRFFKNINWQYIYQKKYLPEFIPLLNDNSLYNEDDFISKEADSFFETPILGKLNKYSQRREDHYENFEFVREGVFFSKD